MGEVFTLDMYMRKYGTSVYFLEKLTKIRVTGTDFMHPTGRECVEILNRFR